MEAESSFVRDRTNLDKAHKSKDQANDAYKEGDYAVAIKLYHECLLFAKAVTQLSITGLQDLARDERALGDADSSAHSPVTPQSPPSGPVEGTILNDQPPSSSTPLTSGEESSSKQASSLRRSRIDSTTRGEEMKLEALDLICKCYNNLAACIVNGPVRSKDDYLRAVSYCDKVLEIEKGNEKALFRKGCAYKKAGKFDKAIELFKQCNQKSAQTMELIKECELKEVEERKKRDAAIRANFAKHRARGNDGNGDDGGAGGAAMNGNAVNGNVPGH